MIVNSDKVYAWRDPRSSVIWAWRGETFAAYPCGISMEEARENPHPSQQLELMSERAKLQIESMRRVFGDGCEVEFVGVPVEFIFEQAESARQGSDLNRMWREGGQVCA